MFFRKKLIKTQIIKKKKLKNQWVACHPFIKSQGWLQPPSKWFPRVAGHPQSQSGVACATPKSSWGGRTTTGTPQGSTTRCFRGGVTTPTPYMGWANTPMFGRPASKKFLVFFSLK
jgi:hypothetical protein